MKKLLFFLAALSIGILLLIWIGRTVGWQEIKNAILVFSGWQGLVILSLTVLIILMGVWEWKIILRGENINISFRDLFRPYLAGFSIMYLASILIIGREAFRSYVLKKKHSVSWSKGIASAIIDRTLDFTTELVFIFFGIIFFLLLVGFPPRNLGIIFGSMFLIPVAGISFFYFKILKKESIANFFIKIFVPKYQNNNAPLQTEKEIFDFFRIKNKYMWLGFGLTFLEKVIKLLRTWLLVLFLGKNINFLAAVSILGFSYLAMMVPIPANLGSHEVVQVFVFDSLGMGAGAGAAFTMIIRGAELIIALFGVFILFRLGSGLLRESFLKQNNNLS